mgnify:CR=1 FL=1
MRVLLTRMGGEHTRFFLRRDGLQLLVDQTAKFIKGACPCHDIPLSIDQEEGGEGANVIQSDE